MLKSLPLIATLRITIGGDILESKTQIKEGEEMKEHIIPESSPLDQGRFRVSDPIHTYPPPPPLLYPPPPLQTTEAMRTYNIPVSSKKDATLLIPGSITIDEYGFIQEWIEKMKNAIVEHEADDTASFQMIG